MMANFLNSRFDRDKLTGAEDSQVRLRETVKKTAKFTNAERDALDIDNPEAFQTYWGDTLEAKLAFDRQHEHDTGRVAKGVTNFGSTAFNVLQNFNPMVEVIKEFGYPYGTLAVGTICFLFAVRCIHSMVL